jgi:hypothetical protein
MQPLYSNASINPSLQASINCHAGGRDVLAEERDTRKSREELAEGGSLVGELEIDSFSHVS